MLTRTALACLVLVTVTAIAVADPVVELDDPVGDDHGDGRFVYPSQGFRKGDLDVVGFKVENKGDRAVFTVEFADNINKPQRGASDELGTDFTKVARHGFWQFNLDIYIDTDRRHDSGYTRLLPGRLATVTADQAWDLAVIAAPRPDVIQNQLTTVLRRELTEAQQRNLAPEDRGSKDDVARQAAATLDRHVYFPPSMKVRGKKLTFSVPHTVLGGPARDTWGYLVFVTGASLEVSLELFSGIGIREGGSARLGTLPISPGEEWTNRFGGGQSGEALQPAIVDLFVPAGQVQETVLADYSSRDFRPAVLPMVVPSEIAAAAAGAAAMADKPRWQLQSWQGKVCYEIFVRSFKDSDGDGIGDFRGIVEKLDYLNDGNPNTDTDLGVEALWLMPVFASPSYHGYDAIDYYRLNPQYGTEADFDLLLAECHRRGIQVVLDLMINHCSSQHPWFVDSARSADSERRDWFVWRQDDPGWTQPWGSGPTWHERNGSYYYGIFWSGMPDFDFRNPAVMNEAEKIAAFWLDRGVAGFRLDAARHLVEAGPGEQQNDTPETHAAWKEYSTFLRARYPDRLMLGEIWSGPEDVAPYYGDAASLPGGDEFAMTFNFDLAGGILQAVNLGDSGPLTSILSRMDALYPDGVLDGTFLANHDMTRLTTQLGGNLAKHGQAAAILLTLPGTPWLYYGEEVGLNNPRDGGDEDKRTPMPWNDSDAGFTAGVPWFRFAPGRDTANVAAQSDDPESLLSRYRNLIHLRRQNPALQQGNLTLVTLEEGKRAAVAYERQTETQRVLVVHNLAAEAATISWSLASPATGYALAFGDRGVGLPADDAITLPAHATAVWTLDP